MFLRKSSVLELEWHLALSLSEVVAVVCIWNVEVFALVCSVTVSVNRDEDEFLASLAFSCSVTRTESDWGGGGEHTFLSIPI